MKQSEGGLFWMALKSNQILLIRKKKLTAWQMYWSICLGVLIRALMSYDDKYNGTGRQIRNRVNVLGKCTMM